MSETKEITHEQALIGSCLASKEALNFCFYHVEEDHFQDPIDSKLFEIIKRLFKQGIDVDPVTLTGSMTPAEKKKIPASYVFDISEKFPTSLNYRHYANLMKKNFITVSLAKRYEKAIADPFDMENQKAIRKLWDLLNGEGNSVIDSKEATMRYTETLEARKVGIYDRVMSGYRNLDNIIGGFYRGNMIVIGARTSVGKTSFLLNMTTNFIKQKIKVLYVSAEMTWDELLDRIVSSEGGVFVSKLRRGEISKAEYTSVIHTLGEVSEMPLYCIEGGRMNMARIRLAAEIVKPDAIFVDFIQRFTPPNANQNRAAFFSDLANELKALAMEKKIVVVAASQMNREIEKQDRRDPQLSDLKESGGIEEAADVAVLMQSEKNDDVMMPERKITFHVKKNRHGPTGQVEFMFEKRLTRFVESIDTGGQIEERNPAGND